STYVRNTAAFTFTALPGTFTLYDAGSPQSRVQFTLGADGTVGYDPSLQGILSGAGTSTLTVVGRSVTVDTRGTSLAYTNVDAYDYVRNTAAFTFTALPGTFTLYDVG